MMNRATRSICIILTLILTSILTYWQASKAYNQYLTLNQTESAYFPIAPGDNHKHIELTGEFQPHLFIQPRSHQHKPGYSVWAPFVLPDKTWIIVSLGFMEEPSIPATQHVSGIIRYLSSPPFQLSQQALSEFPAIVPQLDLPLFAQALDQTLAPYVILMDGYDDQTLVQASTDTILKHVNYAFQFLIIGSMIALWILLRGPRGIRGRTSSIPSVSP